MRSSRPWRFVKKIDFNKELSLNLSVLCFTHLKSPHIFVNAGGVIKQPTIWIIDQFLSAIGDALFILYASSPLQNYSEALLLALLARASTEAITSSKFSSTSPGKFSKTLVERATRPLPSSKSIITALIG